MVMDAGPGRRVSSWDEAKALVARVVGGGPVGDAEVAVVVALAGVVARRRLTVGTAAVDLASLQAAQARLAPWWRADAERIGETLWWLGDLEPAAAQLPSAVDSGVVLAYRADRTGLPLIGGRSLRDVLPRADEAARATLGAALLARAVARLPLEGATAAQPVVLVPVPAEPVEQQSWNALMAEWEAIGPATASLPAPAPTSEPQQSTVSIGGGVQVPAGASGSVRLPGWYGLLRLADASVVGWVWRYGLGVGLWGAGVVGSMQTVADWAAGLVGMTRVMLELAPAGQVQRVAFDAGTWTLSIERDVPWKEALAALVRGLAYAEPRYRLVVGPGERPLPRAALLERLRRFEQILEPPAEW